MHRALLAFALAFVPAVALVACVDESTGQPPPKPIGISDAAAPDTAVADAADATDAPSDQSSGAQVRCTQAEFDAVAAAPNGGDYTASSNVVISFPEDAPPQQYENRCVKVKVGATITFTGNFASHPLAAQGGDTPTPVPAKTNLAPEGGVLTVTMSAVGKYGFECDFHPDTMFGAIQVVP